MDGFVSESPPPPRWDQDNCSSSLRLTPPPNVSTFMGSGRRFRSRNGEDRGSGRRAPRGAALRWGSAGGLRGRAPTPPGAEATVFRPRRTEGRSRELAAPAQLGRLPASAAGLPRRARRRRLPRLCAQVRERRTCGCGERRPSAALPLRVGRGTRRAAGPWGRGRGRLGDGPGMRGREGARAREPGDRRAAAGALWGSDWGHQGALPERGGQGSPADPRRAGAAAPQGPAGRPPGAQAAAAR